MTIERTIQIVQMAYPQVYLACHTRHQRKRTTVHALSGRDSAILAHLDEREGIAPANLARHLGVARSTLSAARYEYGQQRSNRNSTLDTACGRSPRVRRAALRSASLITSPIRFSLA